MTISDEYRLIKLTLPVLEVIHYYLQDKSYMPEAGGVMIGRGKIPDTWNTIMIYTIVITEYICMLESGIPIQKESPTIRGKTFKTGKGFKKKRHLLRHSIT